MFITGLGTATPARRYTQRECWEAAQTVAEFSRLNTRSRSIIKKVLLGNNGIVSRHLALNSVAEAFEMTPDALHARFAHHAPLLATQAAERALEQARLKPADVGAVIISRSEEHTSELQSRPPLVCRLLLDKNKRNAEPPPSSTSAAAT